MRVRACAALSLVAASWTVSGWQPVADSRQPDAVSRQLSADAERWVAATLKKMTLDEKVGQLLVSSFGSEYLSTDSREFDALAKAVRDDKIGGFHVFGGAEAIPDVLLGCSTPTTAVSRSASRSRRRRFSTGCRRSRPIRC